MPQNATHAPLRSLLWVILLPPTGLAAGVGLAILFGLNHTVFENLVVNLVFLATVVGLFPFLNLSPQEIGLRVIKSQIGQHITLSLAILAFYLAFYLFVIRLTALRPFSMRIFWGLLTNLAVVLAEEFYFRGLLFGFIEKRFSAKTALIFSSLLFGLFHARQGMIGIVSRVFTGWLWGSVRYATGMIFLLIFPVHYAFNTVWLLFAGNWNNPPGWALYALPAGEFLFGLLIVYWGDKQAGRGNPPI